MCGKWGEMGKKIQNLTLVSWKLVHLPEVGEVGDNDADELERTGPRHDQPEIDKEDSGSPEGGGEARPFILDGGCFSHVVGSSDAGVLALEAGRSVCQ